MNAISTRQAIAITKLLVSCCFRNGTVALQPEDYIKAAVLSTFPEDQALAQRVAVDLLFPKEAMSLPFFGGDEPETSPDTGDHGSESDSVPTPCFGNGLQQIDDRMQGALDFLGAFPEDIMRSPEGNDPPNNQEQKCGSPALDFSLECQSNLQRGTQPFKSLANALNASSGQGGNQVTDLNSLHNAVQNQIRQHMNQLSPGELAAIPHTNMEQEVLQNSTNPVEQAVAQYASHQYKNFKKTMEDLSQNNPLGAAQVMRALHDADLIDQQKFEKGISQAMEDVSKCPDLSQTIKQTGYCPPELKEKFLNQLGQQSLDKALETLNSLNPQNPQSSNLTRELLDKLQSESKLANKMTASALEQLPFHSQAAEDWLKDQLSQEQESLNKAGDSRKYEDALNKWQEIRQNLESPSYDSTIKKGMQDMAKDWLNHAKNRQEFLNTCTKLASTGLRLPKDKLISQAQAAGCSREEAERLFSTPYDRMLKSVKDQSQDAAGYSTMLRDGHFSPDQIDEITQEAFNSNNRDALAALSEEDLERTCRWANSENNQNMLATSLGAGNGENLLKQWFLSRDRISPALREKVKGMLRNVVVNTSLKMARFQFGTADNGLLWSSSTRLGRDGDEMELVDVEETVDNLAMSGKTPKQILSEDFIVHQTQKGRVSAVILIDISGSMNAVERLSYCTLLATMLVLHLREQEVAIALFESNTHVMVEFGKPGVDIDQIVDELLDIHSYGGTVINRALQWAYKQMQAIEGKNTYFIVASDFCLYYSAYEQTNFQGIEKLHPKTYLITPANDINQGEIQCWERALGAQTLPLFNQKQIIEQVCHILSDI